jgi:hypothetical protein
VALVVVDAENVRRSSWPNMSRDDVLARARAWARREGHDLLVVFDGAAPDDAPDARGSPHADDAIAAVFDDRRAADHHEHEPAWLVTSDRALRARVGDRAERTIGGGTFLRTLLD